MAAAPTTESELLADHPVDRIGAAATDGDEEARCSDQQHIFVTTATRRIALRQMDQQQSHQHLDGQRRRKKAREQADDQTNAADQFEENDDIGPEYCGLETV